MSYTTTVSIKTPVTNDYEGLSDAELLKLALAKTRRPAQFVAHQFIDKHFVHSKNEWFCVLAPLLQDDAFMNVCKTSRFTSMRSLGEVVRWMVVEIEAINLRNDNTNPIEQLTTSLLFLARARTGIQVDLSFMEGDAIADALNEVREKQFGGQDWF